MDERNQKNPDFAFDLDGARYLQITDRGNLHCSYWPSNYEHLLTLRGGGGLAHEPSVTEILHAVGDPKSWTEIVFCGPGEPTLRLYEFLDAARRIRERGGRVRLETDGLANAVYGRDIAPDLEGSVDHLSILLFTQDETSYARYCHCQLDRPHNAVLEFARRARDFVPALTLVALDGLDAVDLAACERIAAELGAGFAAVRCIAAPTH
jgi:TatD family-associated radical SAM protein